MREPTLMERFEASQASMNIYKGRYEALEHSITKDQAEFSRIDHKYSKLEEYFLNQQEILNYLSSQISLLRKEINKLSNTIEKPEESKKK